MPATHAHLPEEYGGQQEVCDDHTVEQGVAYAVCVKKALKDKEALLKDDVATPLQKYKDKDKIEEDRRVSAGMEGERGSEPAPSRPVPVVLPTKVSETIYEIAGGRPVLIENAGVFDNFKRLEAIPGVEVNVSAASPAKPAFIEEGPKSFEQGKQVNLPQGGEAVPESPEAKAKREAAFKKDLNLTEAYWKGVADKKGMGHD